MRYATILFLLLWGCAANQNSHSNQTGSLGPLKQLDHYLDSLHTENAFNGSLLLAENGNLVMEKAYGVANMETKDSLGEQSSFRLASVSKQFTATAILLLEQEGKLSVDDPIQKYLPELPYQGASIRNLLTHTSGMPDYITLLDSLWDEGVPVSEKKTAFNEDALAMIVKHQPPIEFEPGAAYAYSNTGFVLLALIVKRVSGQQIGAFLKEKVFDRLGMVHTRSFSPDSNFQVPHRVYGFSYDSGEKGYLPNDWNYLNGMVGDGGFYSSVFDLLLWDQALYTDEILSAQSKEKAFSAFELNDGTKSEYGFGWGLTTTATGGKVVQHSGGWVGSRTFFRRELDDRRTLILLTNYSAENMGEILEKIKQFWD